MPRQNPPSDVCPQRCLCCCTRRSRGRLRRFLGLRAVEELAGRSSPVGLRPRTTTAMPCRRRGHPLHIHQQSASHQIPVPRRLHRTPVWRRQSHHSASQNRPTTPGIPLPQPQRCWIRSSTGHSPYPPSLGYPRHSRCCCRTLLPSKRRWPQSWSAGSGPEFPKPATAPPQFPATAGLDPHPSHRFQHHWRSTVHWHLEQPHVGRRYSSRRRSPLSGWQTLLGRPRNR